MKLNLPPNQKGKKMLESVVLKNAQSKKVIGGWNESKNGPYGDCTKIDGTWYRNDWDARRKDGTLKRCEEK